MAPINKLRVPSCSYHRPAELPVVFKLRAFEQFRAPSSPQGLPATVTSLLTLTALRLKDRNVLIKRTDIIENLGVATIIARCACGHAAFFITVAGVHYCQWQHMAAQGLQRGLVHCSLLKLLQPHPPRTAQRQDGHPDSEQDVCRQRVGQPGAARGLLLPAAAAGESAWFLHKTYDLELKGFSG